MSYILGLEISIDHILYSTFLDSYINIIFLFKLGIFLFPLLTNSFFFLKHVVTPIRLELHVTQEVPLPPYFSITFVALRTMFSFVGGRVEEGSFVINAKLFW